VVLVGVVVLDVVDFSFLEDLDGEEEGVMISTFLVVVFSLVVLLLLVPM